MCQRSLCALADERGAEQAARLRDEPIINRVRMERSFADRQALAKKRFRLFVVFVLNEKLS